MPRTAKPKKEENVKKPTNKVKTVAELSKNVAEWKTQLEPQISMINASVDKILIQLAGNEDRLSRLETKAETQKKPKTNDLIWWIAGGVAFAGLIYVLKWLSF